MINIDPTPFSTHKLCVWYLVHSDIYYQYDNSIITDETFDAICKELLKRIKQGEEIPQKYKEFISINDLEAGTGYGITFHHLPQIIKDLAYILHLGKDFEGKEINYDKWVR
jgi:hypothetical protein